MVGFSPTERSVLQDMGEVGVAGDGWYVWRGRIRDKIIPILIDAGSIMKYYHNIGLDDFILEDMQRYIADIHVLTSRALERAEKYGYTEMPIPQEVLDRTPGLSIEERQFLKGQKRLPPKDIPVWKFRVKKKVKDIFIDTMILLIYDHVKEMDLDHYLYHNALAVIREVNQLSQQVMDRAKAENRKSKAVSTVKVKKRYQ